MSFSTPPDINWLAVDHKKRNLMQSLFNPTGTIACTTQGQESVFDAHTYVHKYVTMLLLPCRQFAVF